MAMDSDSGDESGGGEAGPGFHALYDAKEVIGKGMSSVVRRCVSRASGEALAVKIIELDSETLDPAMAERLRLDARAEARHLKSVNGDSHIIELRDFFETKSSMHLVFELAPQGELFDYLSRQATVSERKTRAIMRQLFLALQRLHRKRIVHRDIKPENILMLDDEQIKLTDFGFAYELQPGERLFELVGTPGYLAPEVLRASMYEGADGYEFAVDLWASGVIMYTLICGYAPFFHRRQLQMLRSIAEGRYQFRSPDWDAISESSKDLIRGLLTVDAAKRLTATEALAHPFIVGLGADLVDVAPPKFNARARFRAAICQVRSLIRLLHVARMVELVPVDSLVRRPYSHRQLRRTVDAMAFRIYGHWVKKDGEQYRDTLFAYKPQKVRRKRHRISIQS